MESTAATTILPVDSSTFQPNINNNISTYSNNQNNRWNEHYYGNGINMAETYYRNQLQQLNYPQTSNFLFF